jgi:hypothetical protein
MAWQGCSPPRRADLTPQVVPGKQDFDVPVPYVEGTLDVFLNGVGQGVPPTHWSETSDTTLHLVDPVEAGDNLTVWFQAKA